VSEYKVLESIIYNRYPRFIPFKKGLNAWIIKDVNNCYMHKRPKVSNDLNIILEKCIWTNKVLLEYKKLIPQKLLTGEYDKFSKYIEPEKISKNYIIEKMYEDVKLLNNKKFEIKAIILVTSVNPIVVWLCDKY